MRRHIELIPGLPDGRQRALPRRSRAALAPFVAVALLAAACGDDGSDSDEDETEEEAAADSDAEASGQADPVIDPGDGGDYAPDVDPENFVDEIDNPYLPLTPGAEWTYEGVTEDGETERVEVVVTDERREIMGISATVVRDTATVDGELAERTFDWFAQDREGNVWYMGEDSVEYVDGEEDPAGSWEAGVDGALPGIVMPADPTVGDAYRQEYYAGEAEDMGEVVRLGDEVSVPAGDFDDLLVTNDWTPLEPEIVEEKYYAAGVGLVMERKVAGEKGQVELISTSVATQ